MITVPHFHAGLLVYGGIGAFGLYAGGCLGYTTGFLALVCITIFTYAFIKENKHGPRE